jgi:competence protein ComEA
MRPKTFLLALVVSALPIGFVACNNNQSPSPEQVRQKTAEATATIKDDAKALGEGVREGLSRPSSDKPLDLNTASKASLMGLPGIDDASADRIIADRPYSSEHQLLDKRVVSRDEYSKIAGSVTVGK